MPVSLLLRPFRPNDEKQLHRAGELQISIGLQRRHGVVGMDSRERTGDSRWSWNLVGHGACSLPSRRVAAAFTSPSQSGSQWVDPVYPQV